MRLEKYRKQAEDFLGRVDKEYYLHYSGQKDSLNLTGIYERFDWLFERKNIDYFRGLKDSSSGEERKKASYLLKFCTEGYLEREVKELLDKIAGDEAKARINIEGKDVPFRFSEILLANERQKDKRDLIEDKRNKLITGSFNADLAEYWDNLHELAGDLGFNSYKELFSYLKEEDFDGLSVNMENLLSATQDLYQDHFGRLLQKELGLSLDDSRRSDFAYLKRAGSYDRFFKKEALVEVFKDTVESLGIDVFKLDNITIDVEERKNKSPRAFCSIVRVPEEIYLVVMPSGGQDDYEAVFHEAGHSLHYGLTSPRLDFEYRFLGDNAVTEGYAFTMEHLMKNQGWLSDFMGMSPEAAREFVYFSTLIKLWFLRRYAGKLKYELILHDGSGLTGKDETYKDILSSVGLMEYPTETFLKDVDESFYSTNYIRAWIFEAQLKDYIHRKFGYGWYRKRSAGMFLRELWEHGQKFSVTETLNQLDFKKLDISYLISSITEVLKSV